MPERLQEASAQLETCAPTAEDMAECGVVRVMKEQPATGQGCRSRNEHCDGGGGGVNGHRHIQKEQAMLQQLLWAQQQHMFIQKAQLQQAPTQFTPAEQAWVLQQHASIQQAQMQQVPKQLTQAEQAWVQQQHALIHQAQMQQQQKWVLPQADECVLPPDLARPASKKPRLLRPAVYKSDDLAGWLRPETATYDGGVVSEQV